MPKCLCCDAEIQSLPKKRAKQFCDSTCRSNYWQKQKRKETANVPKKEIPVKPVTGSFRDFLNKPDKGNKSEKLTPIQELRKKKMGF